MRVSCRAVLVTLLAALGLVAGVVAPAQAASGYARCPVGKFCLFDGDGGSGAMAVYAASQAALGAWDNKANSVYNRTGNRYYCLYSGADYRYVDQVHDVAVYGGVDGKAEMELTPYQDANSHMANNLSSFRLSRTIRQCEGGPEYIKWFSPTYTIGTYPAHAFGDLNGDGNSDLLLRTYSGRLWFESGDGTGKLVGAGWNAMTALTRHGDLNGDGTEDLLAKETTGKLWLYPGNGRAGFGTRTLLAQGWSGITRIQAAGDLNGDGKGDLLARDTAGKLWLYAGTGKGTFRPRSLIGPGWNTMRAFAAPGDLTGDGRSDLAVTDSAGRLWLYPGTGHGSFGTRRMIGSGGWNAFSELLGVGDIYGDSRPDLIAAQTVNFRYFGMIDIYCGRGGGTVGSAGSFGNADLGDTFV